MSADGGTPWTAEQLGHVAEVRPRLLKFAARLARQYPVLENADIVAIAEDRVLQDVRRFDASRGMSLFSFSFRGIVRDVTRAAYARLSDPARTAWNAARRYAMEAEPASLDERISEGPDERLDRARGLGVEAGLAAALAYECHLGRDGLHTPEQDVLAKETRDGLAAAVASMGSHTVTLVRLLYVEETTYEEAARTLNATVPQVKYSERKLLADLRKHVAR